MLQFGDNLDPNYLVIFAFSPDLTFAYLSNGNFICAFRWRKLVNLDKNGIHSGPNRPYIAY